MNSSSSDEEIFLTQRQYRAKATENDYDTDNLVSDIVGLEKVQPENRKPYAPQCSDISDTVDGFLTLTAENIEKDFRFHEPKTDKEISELQSKQLSLKQSQLSVYFNDFIKG